jgi:hypothetical protein
MTQMNALLQTGSWVLVLALCYLFFFARRRGGFMRFVKYVMLPVTLGGAWVVYFIGYHAGAGEGTSVQSVLTHALQAMYSAGGILLLGNDIVAVPTVMRENATWFLWFNVISASALFVFAAIALDVFGRRLVTRTRIALDRATERHIFFGVNDASIALAGDLLARDARRQVICVVDQDEKEDAGLQHRMEEAGGLILRREPILERMAQERDQRFLRRHGRRPEPAYMKKLRLLKRVLQCPSHLYLLGTAEEWNMRMAEAVLKEIEGLPIPHHLSLYVRTQGWELHEVFREHLRKPHPNVHIRLIDEAVIAARQLAVAYHPVAWIAKDTARAIALQDFTIMMIGFGQTGNAVLRKLVECGQFVHSRFSAVVIDRALHDKRGRFENRFPGIVANYPITFIQTTAGSARYFREITQRAQELDYIVVSLGDDALNLTTAVDLQQTLVRLAGKRVNILVHVSHSDRYCVVSDPSQPVQLNVFGRTDDIFTERIVVRSAQEAAALAIHNYYNARKAEPERMAWDDLTTLEKATNVSAAEHLLVKLALGGLGPDDLRGIGSMEEFERLLGSDRMRNLAEGEHLRWNAALLAHGWTTWRMEDIPDSAGHKDDARKRHACLVEWDELPAVGRRYGEDFQNYDYDAVRNVFTLYREGLLPPPANP